MRLSFRLAVAQFGDVMRNSINSWIGATGRATKVTNHADCDVSRRRAMSCRPLILINRMPPKDARAMGWPCCAGLRPPWCSVLCIYGLTGVTPQDAHKRRTLGRNAEQVVDRRAPPSYTRTQKNQRVSRDHCIDDCAQEKIRHK